MTGQTAEKAASVLEAAGFRPTLDPEPEDPELCKVADQDQTGEIEEGSEVILTVDCMVDVPDVSGDPADDAVSKLTALGLTTSFEEKPDDSSACTVESQDVVGQAEAGSEVVLTVRCVLPDVTGRDLRSAVAALQRIGYDADHPPVRDPRVCSVTSHRTQAEPGATVALTVHCPG